MTVFDPVGALYHLFLTIIRFWLCSSFVLTFSDSWQVLALFEYCTIFFWLVTGCFVWVYTIFFLRGDRFWLCFTILSDRLQVLDLFEYCTIIFWLVTGLFCLRIAPSFSNCWQVLALFEYFTIFFWLVTGFGADWELHNLFLAPIRFWHCLSIVPSFSDWWQVLALFEYCTIFFLTGDRFWLCFEYCTIFFCFQVLALFEYFTIFFWIVTGFVYG